MWRALRKWVLRQVRGWGRVHIPASRYEVTGSGYLPVPSAGESGYAWGLFQVCKDFPMIFWLFSEKYFLGWQLPEGHLLRTGRMPPFNLSWNNPQPVAEVFASFPECSESIDRLLVSRNSLPLHICPAKWYSNSSWCFSHWMSVLDRNWRPSTP